MEDPEHRDYGQLNPHRHMRRAASPCALALLLILGVGCAERAPLVPMQLDDFVSQVLPELNVRSRLTETIRTLMTIQVTADGETSEARTILWFKRPDAFRLDVLDPLNAPMVVVRASGNVISLVHLREGHGFRGPLTDDLLRREFGMDIRISDVRSAIYADPFQDGLGDDVQVATQGDHVIVRRLSRRVGHVEEIHISHVGTEPVVDEWWVRTPEGDEVQHVRFWNYQAVGGILRPLDALIERPKDDARLRFHAVDPEINLDLSDASFRHTFPPGADIRQVEG